MRVFRPGYEGVPKLLKLAEEQEPLSGEQQHEHPDRERPPSTSNEVPRFVTESGCEHRADERGTDRYEECGEIEPPDQRIEHDGSELLRSH